MQVHEKKRFIGRTIQGFDFLRYTIHPFRRLRPSDESIRRFQDRARRLWRGSPDREVEVVSMAVGRCKWEGLTYSYGLSDLMLVIIDSVGFLNGNKRKSVVFMQNEHNYVY